MANGKSTGAGSRKRGGRKARSRGSGEPRSSGALEAGTADDNTDHATSENALETVATESDDNRKVSIPSVGSTGKQVQQLFTVGTFDEEDHGSALPTGSRATEPGLPANAVIHNNREMRKPMFTMGSHSEASDIDVPVDTKAEGAGQASAGSHQLHACKATTGLSRLGHSEPAACDSGPAHESRLASAPPEASERAQRGRSRTIQSRDAHSKMRKKVASKKSHVKKATSSAALRSRMRANTALRRESQPNEHSRDSAGDSSYVDYSDDADGSEPAPAPPRSQHSSTATLGDAEDSATTASIDSPRPELQSSQDPEPPQPDPEPRTQRRDEHAGAFVAKNIKRNMESQRQQVLVEQEEEDMEITCALLTGMPRRRNRPPGMAPHAFLAPDTHAYNLQVHRSERAYAHVRATAHPLLKCISRCVALREHRVAACEMPRSRRPPLEPRSHARAEWWESLMPPPPTRTPELPSWALPLDSAKCAVYDMQTHDPACGHVRELRARAADLRISRQHPAPAARAVSGETWHGRRIPGLLSVRSFPMPLNLAATRSDTETWTSSPDSAVIPRSNPLAPPYRRYGTVYGHTSANPANGPNGFLINGSALRRQDSLQTSHPNTASILENDPRRSSYFDRLSIEEDRPQPAASATQPNPVALLRRVISGLTGGNANFGSSQ
ncbi:hypothetical protein IWW36_003390 [Coemansia brasiliensis]|uniref:Uncharacterized protein n=1 Tax=Coemansia brasiliensis TaxID=2650707 RepID=A0A9W8I7W2_9FUNG|nr:hypothetical protein IWW36_003390 [Coemansia brasiliensis]